MSYTAFKSDHSKAAPLCGSFVFLCLVFLMLSRVFIAASLVREPAIGLIKWLRPKGLKVCSYEERCAEFKNQTLKKSAGTLKCYLRCNTPLGRHYLKIALKWGVSL